MTAEASHIAWKDLRQHDAWFGVYLVVVLLRALLIGSGIDAAVRDRSVLESMGLAYQMLSGLHLALIVTLAVQIVHGDRLVGTTAFWLTRAVARRSLLASKLALAFVFVVAVPVLLDVLVIVRHGLSWIDALGAAAEGALLRAGVLLPLMALAAVTADLAVFVVSGIAAVFSTVAVVAALEWLRLLSSRPSDVGDTIFVAVLAVVGVGALAAFVHQVFTRRTKRSALILAGSVALAIAAANGVERPIVSVPGSLEAGWLVPSRVTVTLGPLAASRLNSPMRQDRPWDISATYDITGTTPNVTLMPLGFRTTLTAPDGASSHDGAVYQELIQQAGWDARAAGVRFVRRDKVERLLGGIRLLDAQEAVIEKSATRPIAALTQATYDKLSALGYVGPASGPAGEQTRTAGQTSGLARFDIDAIVGALAYEACRPVPLQPGAGGQCGDRRFTLLSAEFTDGACIVGLRDVVAGFIIDLRRRSGVVYVLANRAKGEGLVVGTRNYYDTQTVFGRATFALLGEHVAVTHRNLVFRAPTEMPDIGPDWLRDAVIVPLQVRDIGQLTVKAKIRM
jgi:hypothetical protein